MVDQSFLTIKSLDARLPAQALASQGDFFRTPCGPMASPTLMGRVQCE